MYGSRFFVAERCNCCACMHLRASCAVAFAIYDADKKGYISQLDLKHMLQESFKENDVHISDSQIEKLVADTFKTCDADRDGYVPWPALCGTVTSLHTACASHACRSLSLPLRCDNVQCDQPGGVQEHVHHEPKHLEAHHPQCG